MITLPLQLTRSPTPQRPAAAWFLAGDDPRAWLDEVLTWGVPAGTVRLYVIPQSPGGRRPCGALVVVDGNATLHPGPRAHPYGCIAGRLYLPIEAVLTPPATDSELTAALPDPAKTYVWHPIAGFVGFAPEEARQVRDFLAPPSRRPTAWDRAVPGIALNARLIALEPAEPPTLASIFEAARDDIGGQAGDLDDLPPLPDEKPASYWNPAQSLKRGFARFVRGMTDRAPRTAGRETWVDRAAQWAGRVLAQPDLDERDKELRRLLHLLEHQPDEGLRYALPMGGNAHRGVALPSSHLARRDVNFDLSHLGGGQAADYWDVPPEIRQQLATHYRDLANREMRLGRHRRAAYIFAELLGDVNAAASALAGGGHFREAAVLYQDRLNRSFDAARCLEQGGLWSEAAALYEKLEAYEQAGDLYVRLGQPKEADAAYDNAAGAALLRNDFLKAAQLFETKLNDPDAALNSLDDGWPHSNQAAACLDETFRLLGRHGRHDAARAMMTALRNTPRSMSATAMVVDTLVTVSTTYPDTCLRPEAEDFARIVASAVLPHSRNDAVPRILRSLRRLVPHDRLHARDIDRFEQMLAARKPRRSTTRPPTVRPPTADPLHFVREISLPKDIHWQAADANLECFYMAGFAENQLILVRGFWSDDRNRLDRVGWSGGTARRAPIILAANQNDAQSVLIALHQSSGSSLPPRTFDRPVSSTFSGCALTPSLIDRYPFGLAQSAGAMCGVSYDDEDFVVTFGTPSGVLISQQGVRLDQLSYDAEETQIPFPVHHRTEGAYIGIGRQLVSIAKDPLRIREMPAPIRGLCGSRPHTRFRLGMAFSRGAGVMWDDREQSLVSCAEDIDEPVICLTASGALVVAGADRCEVYNSSHNRLRLIAVGPLPGKPRFAVLPTKRPNQFALCTHDGTIRIYEFNT